MKTLYDIINESKNISDRVFKVVGSDDTIDSVWQNEQDAKLACDKANQEIGGNFFSVKSDKSEDFIK